MKKLGIVTGYHIINYGSALQAYATQKVVDDLGYDNECICYQKTKNIKQLLRIFNIPLLKTKLATIKKNQYAKKKAPELYYNFEKRNKKFEEFVTKSFRVSKPYVGYETLKENAKNYSGFLLGSDQVWNPLNLGSDYYTLNFVPKGMPRLTYAPSFGVSHIPNYQKRRTIDYLKRIDYLSVREKAGQDLIKELTGRDAKIVVDPTLLLTRENWASIMPQEKIVTEKYIFCYFLGTNPKHREFAEKLKEITGYQIVTLPHMDEIVERDLTFGDKQLFEIGPSEFLNLLSNAELVCTDSFHGTVFSILHHRKFFTFSRHAETRKVSTNSRLQSLLTLLKLETRMFSANENVEEALKEEMHYEETDKILSSLREDSMQYLSKALKETQKEEVK